jgi:hypothetical protein
LKAAVSKYWQLLFGLILLIGILIFAFVLLIIPIPGIDLIAQLGFSLLLIIPGFYLIVRLGFAFYAIAVEDCSAIEGIQRSWKLTQGRWWSIFGALLAVFLALFVPTLIISILVTISIGEEIGSRTYDIISGVLNYLVGPISSVYYVLLYAGLQNRDRRQQAERG